MKFKEYYSYKKKFLIKTSRPKVKRGSEVILSIKSTLNNIFVGLLDSKGKLNYFKTSGSFGFKSTRDRNSKQAYETMIKDITKELLSRGCSKVFVFFVGVSRRSFRWLRYLKQGGIDVVMVKDLTRLPYNGCRLKKEPRG